MLYKYFSVILILTVFCYVSCSDKSTLSEEETTGTVTDIDGNEYQTIKIGDQWWMAENLKVIYYRNGDTIPNVTDDSEWSNLNIGAYCSYNNDDGYINTYGLLYNWYAVNDGRNIAPAGWHVPSDEEWWTLADQLNGYSLAGHELKSTSGWYDNGNGSNSSGFNALSGGYRYDFSMFLHFGFEAGFWSSTEDTTDKAWYRGLSNLHRVAYPGLVSKQYGFSVRCIRD